MRTELETQLNSSDYLHFDTQAEAVAALVEIAPIAALFAGTVSLSILQNTYPAGCEDFFLHAFWHKKRYQ